MPKIYLSPSTQDWNMYVTGSGSEEYNMNLLADALVPYLLSNGIQYRRNRPEMTAGSSVREANQGEYDLYLALHSNYSDAVWVEGHRDAIAQQIARGLTAYFGLPFIYPMDPVQGTVTVSNGTLNLRDYPSSAGKVIASLPNGAAVTIYGEWNGWYVVHYGDQVGYAAAAYIDT